jgi:hypothetical protein
MPDEGQEGYPLEPHEGDHLKPGEKPGDPAPRAKIEAPGLLSDFDEDADFDRDPELDRVIAGPAASRVESQPADTREEFIRPGFGDARMWTIAGVVLLVAAMIATAINAPNRSVARVLLTLYSVLLHTGTGVVALFLTALGTDRRLGNFELAASRMFVAVAAFALILNLHLNLFGEGYERWKVEELVLAAMAYVLIVSTAFGLWNARLLAYVVGSHFVLWLTVYVGMQLAAHIAAAGGS